jgi:hypothetical protein
MDNKDYNSKVEELRVSNDYLTQITNINLDEMVLSIRYKFIEEIFNDNYITQATKNKLLDGVKAKALELEKKKSDIAKKAITNGANKKRFGKYILN